uniref:anamorsin-like n=1 Tax=Pristiophorus japonicus TaxID=55135 RepID=UPI00398F7D0F
MDQFDIKAGYNVVVIWDSSTTAESQTKLVQDIRAVTGALGHVAMENIERLQISAHRESSFDVVLSGVVPNSAIVHTFEVFVEIARILKPGGRFYFTELVCVSGDYKKLKTASQLASVLKLTGFTDICKMRNESLSPEQLSSIKQSVGYLGTNLAKVRVKAKKPNFEVGSSTQLNLSLVRKPKAAAERPELDPSTKKAWTLSATDMNDDDVVSLPSQTLGYLSPPPLSPTPPPS